MIRNFWLYGLLMLLFQALTACGNTDQSTEAPQPSTSEAKKGTAATSEDAQQIENTDLVIAFGDSLYAGYQLGPKEGLAPQLEAALQAEGHAVTVQNAGVSGDTTAAGKQRLNFVLDAAKRPVKLVILGLGGNDMLRGIKPGETRANLKAMLDELQKREIPVVLTGMLAAPNLGADYAKAFNPIFPELAKEYDVMLYPFFLDGLVTDSKLMLADNIHPNAKGVTTVVEKLSPIVEEALKAQR